jgi:hypothetical protein
VYVENLDNVAIPKGGYTTLMKKLKGINPQATRNYGESCIKLFFVIIVSSEGKSECIYLENSNQIPFIENKYIKILKEQIWNPASCNKIKVRSLVKIPINISFK